MSLEDLELDPAALPRLLPAALAVLLHRTHHRRELLLGVATHNRRNAAEKQAIGLFVGLLPLPVTVRPGMSRGELVRTIRAEMRAGYRHRPVSAEQIRRGLVDEGASSDGRRLFEVVVSYEPQSYPLRLGSAAAEIMAMPSGFSPHPLNVTVRGRRLDLEARRAFFDDVAVRRLGGQLRRLLAAISRRPEQTVDTLDLLDRAERHQLLVEWNDTATDSGDGALVHELIEAQAARTPEAVAVVGDGVAWSYAELDARAERLARRLRELGVGPDARVGILLERTPPLVAAVLGVLKSGGAWVGLDAKYPPERLRFMRQDAGLAALVRGDGEVERSSTVTGLRRRGPAALGGGRLDDAELAGVLAATSVCFDLSIFEIFVPLSRGGRVVLAENALALAELAERDAVTLLNTVPAAAAELARTGLPAGVRTVNLAGEVLEPRLVDALLARGVERVNDLYGPSEDTTYSTWARRRPGGPATIGRPLAGGRVHLLDANLRPVPLGAFGEIFSSGAGVARGYLGRPATTAEHFLPDPFDGTGFNRGGRLYRTGDLARHLDDGSLQFLGRRDHQVKVRGVRVELGEIETALGTHPEVRAVAVAVRDQRLVAFVVARRAAPGTWAGFPRRGTMGGFPRRGTMEEFLRARLPEHLVPALFVEVEALPRLPNGKVDRQALPALDGRRPDLGARFAAPRDELEERIAGLWRELLGVDRVGIDDNFFELGGHSLLLVRAAHRLREIAGRDVPAPDLLRFPTVGALAAHLRGGAPRPRRPAATREAPREAVAVVGLAGRFPGAADVDELWRNLCDGVESARARDAPRRLCPDGARGCDGARRGGGDVRQPVAGRHVRRRVPLSRPGYPVGRHGCRALPHGAGLPPRSRPLRGAPGAELLEPHLGFDPRPVIHAEGTAAEERLRRTAVTQPALFMVEWALARQLASWGVEPRAMLGHSLGEWVAACLAGVFSLEDALRLVALRGRLVGELPEGAMVSLPLAAAEVERRLEARSPDEGLALAAVNAARLSVVSGTSAGVRALEEELGREGVEVRRLDVSHAFHSPLLDPVLERFTAAVREASPAPPRIPVVSNLTGRWLSAEEATEPGYWARHLRHPVRFADGVGLLLAEPRQQLLEVGPGRSLSALARRHPRAEAGPTRSILARRGEDESAGLLTALGDLWVAGVEVDWQAFGAGERRRRVPLPTYPFERRRHWIDARPPFETTAASPSPQPSPPEGRGGRRGGASDRGEPVWDASLSPLEQKIADVWGELLGVERRGSSGGRGGATRTKGSPPRAGNVERSTSWRRATPPRQRSSRAASSRPRRRTAWGML